MQDRLTMRISYTETMLEVDTLISFCPSGGEIVPLR